MENIAFLKADLDKDMAVCVAFRKDSFICSFGSDEKWRQESGEQGELYTQWLIQFAYKNPGGVIHLWQDEKIIGQIEFSVMDGAGKQGYINLFYLVEEKRGSGIADLMHQYIIDELSRKGCLSARLSVSETNQRALSFYKRNGWKYVCPRKENVSVHIYEIQI